MKNVPTLTISFSIIIFALLSLTIDIAHPDTVSPLRPTDDILRSKAAFAVVNEAIARGLNLHTLSELDYWKLRGPVLLDPQADIHYQLREELGRIVNTVDFGASSNTDSANQSASINRGDKPILHKKAAEIIRDFIAQKHISVIIRSDAPIRMGEIAAIRGLRGEVRYTYEIINGASVSVPLQNIAALIKRPFITEIWPNSKGSFKLNSSRTTIGADYVYNELGVTGQGVTVAVVDNGIYKFHPEFRGRITDKREESNGIDQSHGTRVAGIIGAADDGKDVTGVAPEVSLLDANIGGELWALHSQYDEAMEAIGWAAGRHLIDTATTKADVLNISLGWFSWRYGREGDDLMSELIDKIIEEDDMVFVVSAGNEAQGHISATLPNGMTEVEHTFKVDEEGEFHVVLVQDPGDPDLDLEIWAFDSVKNQWELFCEEYSEGKPSHGSEKVYTKVDCNTDPSTWNPFVSDDVRTSFFVKVMRNVNQTKPYMNQKYELWLSLHHDFTVTHHNYTNNSVNDTLAVPGYSKKAITVGAIEKNNTIWEKSSRGPNTSNQPLKPEVVAPGVGIRTPSIKTTLWSVQSNYVLSTGTSFAAPHVAGVAALILDAVGKNDAGKWNFSPEEVKSAIVRGAIGDIGLIPSTPDNTYGAGLVKADNIIFGGTVNPGQKLRFRITPRLVADSYNNLDLDAIGWWSNSIAISWENNSGDLELELLDKNGDRSTGYPPGGGPRSALDPVHTVLSGSNYEKIIYGTVDTFFYLDVVHNDSSGEPIHFTGASIHPIRLNLLDVNGDHVVDVKDLAAVAEVLVAAKKLTVSHSDSHYDAEKDVDGDNDVDLDDMLAIANEIKITGAAAAPSAHPTGIETIQQWLAEVKRMGNIDPDFLQTIEMLEQLLDLLTPIIPMETALLANYPNPFNPETWIPYQLAKPADVTFTIHAVDGSLVRALDLGHQRAGIYQSRTRAAHWDGRNTQGEPVASGVYFYTFKAGDFTATRKMLIRK